MDHKYINEADLVDRYLMRRLAAEESAEFEAHFVDCQECVGQLNSTRALLDGLRIVASDQAPDARGYKSKGLFWWLRPATSRRSYAFAASVLVLVALVGAVVISNQIRRSRAEATRARNESADWERRFEEERESSSLAEMRHLDSERDLKTQVAQLRAELENGNTQNTDEKADDHGALKKAQINLVMLVLRSTRGNEPSTGALNELIVPRSPANFVISVSLEGEGGYKTYRMVMTDDKERVIWKGSGLRPDRHNMLLVEFNSASFRDGDYNLAVEGVGGDGSTSIVGKYSFHVQKTP